MKNFKKVLAFLCSATLIVGSSVTAFATAPSSTAATGNIIQYSNETIVVPTSIKVSFNPQKWAFKLADADTTFVTDQIPSLNYGIHSQATLDKKITISFAATGTTGTGKTIEFVDSIEKAQPKTESNPDGADYGEYKMYLAVVGAKEKITQNRAASPTAFAFNDGAVTDNITDAFLADVDMTVSTNNAGAVAFTKGTTNVADAEISFKLEKAVYEMKTETTAADWSTTDMTTLLKGKTLGDVVGFKFIGAMNENVDWSKANLSAIAIAPTYEIEDVDGTENLEGGYHQIGGAAAASTLALELVTATGNLRYTFPESGRPTGTLTAVTVNGTSRAGAISAGNIFYKADNGNFIITKTAVDNADIGIVQGGTTVVATIGGTEYTFTY
jgi:hypothetical protein